jgi:hypothetical protein
MRQIIIIVAGAMVVGAQAPSAQPRSPKAQLLLEEALRDRAPGETRRCLKTDKINSPIGVDDRTLLFRDGPRIWRNELQGGQGCGDLGGRKALTTFDRPIQVCSGDRMYVMDLRDGMQLGGCILGEFTLYTKQKKKKD